MINVSGSAASPNTRGFGGIRLFIMTHGNKKYFFEQLQQPGDTILVKPKNIYSLKNSARLYIKETDPAIEFDYADEKKGHVLITRIK